MKHHIKDHILSQNVGQRGVNVSYGSGNVYSEYPMPRTI